MIARAYDWCLVAVIRLGGYVLGYRVNITTDANGRETMLLDFTKR